MRNFFVAPLLRICRLFCGEMLGDPTSHLGKWLHKTKGLSVQFELEYVTLVFGKREKDTNIR